MKKTCDPPSNGRPEKDAPLFGKFSRRSFLTQLGAAGLAATAAPIANAAGVAEAPPRAETSQEVPGAVAVTLRVNGKDHQLMLEPRVTLLDALRENLQMFGTKKGCDHGQCGACTVLLNGRRVNACLCLAVMLEGDDITTIEGLGAENALHPLQAAFIAHDGFQCGYCTSGQICSAVGMLAEAGAGWPSLVTDDVATSPPLTDREIAERMSGNLCRCACYPHIVDAVEAAARS